jgi:hypothetical protein
MANATLTPAVVEKVVTETVIEEETITLTLSRDEATFIHSVVSGLNGGAPQYIGLDRSIPYDIYNTLHSVLHPSAKYGGNQFELGDKFRQYLRDYR